MFESSSFGFWHRWLVVVCAMSAVFGFVMAIGSSSVLFESYLEHVDKAFWEGGSPPGVRTFYTWIFAVLGSSIGGWGIALTYIAVGPFGRRERWAHRAMLVSITAWVIVDSSVSWYFGVYQEVLFNSGMVFAAGLPLIATWRHFKAPASAD